MSRVPFAHAELVLDARAELGECPVWDERRRRLAWIDIMAGRLHSTDLETGSTETIVLPSAVGAIVPRSVGGWIAALDDGFWAVDAAGSLEQLALVEADRPDTRFNDGRCDPAGRFWAGTMAYDSRPAAGTLYRLDPDLSVHAMLTDVTVSNGIGWSLDASTMYYADTETGRVDAFDFAVAEGTLANRRPFAVIDASDGQPDGLTVDAEGAVWVALWEGGAIRRYRPDGRLDFTVRLPCSEVTSAAFGGKDLTDLYITTARALLSAEERVRQSLAGGLFRFHSPVPGLPPIPFLG